MTSDSQHVAGSWLNDQLAALLGALRRHVQEAPQGTWDDQTLLAARTVTAALSTRLAGSGNEGVPDDAGG